MIVFAVEMSSFTDNRNRNSLPRHQCAAKCRKHSNRTGLSFCWQPLLLSFCQIERVECTLPPMPMSDFGLPTQIEPHHLSSTVHVQCIARCAQKENNWVDHIWLETASFDGLISSGCVVIVRDQRTSFNDAFRGGRSVDAQCASHTWKTLKRSKCLQRYKMFNVYVCNLQVSTRRNETKLKLKNKKLNTLKS